MEVDVSVRSFSEQTNYLCSSHISEKGVHLTEFHPGQKYFYSETYLFVSKQKQALS